MLVITGVCCARRFLQAQQMTMQTLQALFVDEATVRHSVKFLSDVAAQPATRQATGRRQAQFDVIVRKK